MELIWLSRISLPATLLLLAALSIQRVEAGNTTCVSRQLDWYTGVVGESPCMTYQRLRQICNNDYQVPNLASTVPGDLCEGQVFTCCSNMVAFHLSMLCMVCQQDHQDANGSGIDAPAGTFDVYRNGHPAYNHTLHDDLQQAICNNNIRLDDFLYQGWDDGSWFYVYMKEYADLEHAAHGNNTFTHCPNQTSASSSLSTGVAVSTAAAATPTSSTVSRSHDALIGGVVGGVLGLAVLIVLAIVWMRVRRRTRTGRNGSQWSKIPRFGHAYCSELKRASTAPKSSWGQSMFSSGGPLSSKFSYCDPDFTVTGSYATSPRTVTAGWSDATTGPSSRPSPRRFEAHPRPDDDAPPLPVVRDIETGAASHGGDRPATHARAPSSAGVSVSLSTFDFASARGADDGQTLRGFPLSAVTTNEFPTFRDPYMTTLSRGRSESKGRQR